MLDLLKARAEALAAHDGVPVATVHIHGAANQLQSELLRVRDELLQPPSAEPPAPEPGHPEPALVAETPPEPASAAAAPAPKRASKARAK